MRRRSPMLVVDRPGDVPGHRCRRSPSATTAAARRHRPPARSSSSAAGSGRRRGRSWRPSRSPSPIWQIVVWTGWRPEYVLPGAGHGVRTTRRADRRRHGARGPRPSRCRAGRRRLRPRPRDRRRRRRRRGLVEDRPLGRRLDDHRPADDAVDRLVPAGDPAVQAVRGGDPRSSSCSAPRRRSPTG